MSIIINQVFFLILPLNFIVKYHKKMISLEAKNSSFYFLRQMDIIFIGKQVLYSFRICRFYFSPLVNRVRSTENTTQVQIKNNENANEHSHWMGRRGVFEAGR